MIDKKYKILFLSDAGPDQLRRDPCGPLSSQPDPRQDGGLEVTSIVVGTSICWLEKLSLVSFFDFFSLCWSLLKIFFQAPLYCDLLRPDDLALQVCKDLFTPTLAH